MFLIHFVSKILIVIGLCLTSANAPTIEALQDKITQSVQHQFMVADDESISRPVSSAKPRPKTFYPSLLPYTSVVFLKALVESTFVTSSVSELIQSTTHYARGPPIS